MIESLTNQTAGGKNNSRCRVVQIGKFRKDGDALFFGQTAMQDKARCIRAIETFTQQFQMLRSFSENDDLAPLTIGGKDIVGDVPVSRGIVGKEPKHIMDA